MPLFVQLEDTTGEDVWHVVTSYEDVGAGGRSSRDFERTYTCGCGLVQTAGADRLAEAENPPWTHRHRYKGCFKTAADPQGKAG